MPVLPVLQSAFAATAGGVLGGRAAVEPVDDRAGADGLVDVAGRRAAGREAAAERFAVHHGEAARGEVVLVAPGDRGGRADAVRGDARAFGFAGVPGRGQLDVDVVVRDVVAARVVRAGLVDDRDFQTLQRRARAHHLGVHEVVGAVVVAVDRRGDPDVLADHVGRVEHRLRLAAGEHRGGRCGGLGGDRGQRQREHGGDQDCGFHLTPKPGEADGSPHFRPARSGVKRLTSEACRPSKHRSPP